MTAFLEGCTPYSLEDAEKYNRLRWWPGLTFGDILDRAADIYPDKVAFVDRLTRLTYAQARERADRLAIGLMDRGIKPLDRVLLQLPNWMEFVISYFALQKIGAVVVLLNDRYRQYEINHLARLTGASGWVVAERYGKVDYVPIAKDVLEKNPRIKHVVLARTTGGSPYLSLDELVAASERTQENLQRLAGRRPDPMQVAHMGPTGGTTGLPKVVPRTHNSLICGSEYAARAFEMDIQDTCLLAGPLGHDLAFSKGLLCSILTLGRTVLLDSVEPGEICAAVEREKVTAIVWVPTLAARLVQFGGLGDYNLRSLRKMYCGGGVSLPDLIRSVRDKLSCTFFNAYGSTEGTTTMSRSDDDLETIFHSVGRPTCPYDTYKVVDPSGKPLPPNTPGELVIKGPGVFTGYYRTPEENAKVFTENGCFRTGDVARINEAGHISLTGRLKEMINRGGESISATEIEKLIIDHPDVVSVAVVPMPDLDLGERVCAYVQPRADAALTFDRIIAFLKERKASVHQLPERIEFIAAMPLTKAEKIDKAFLRKDIEEKLGYAS